jgi:hypothetical protein
VNITIIVEGDFMLEKGSFSFVALLVINPMLILMFQNCSFAPIAQSSVAKSSVAAQSRTISSVGIMDKAAPGSKSKFKDFGRQKASADCGSAPCPASATHR